MKNKYLWAAWDYLTIEYSIEDLLLKKIVCTFFHILNPDYITRTKTPNGPFKNYVGTLINFISPLPSFLFRNAFLCWQLAEVLFYLILHQLVLRMFISIYMWIRSPIPLRSWSKMTSFLRLLEKRLRFCNSYRISNP